MLKKKKKKKKEYVYNNIHLYPGKCGVTSLTLQGFTLLRELTPETCKLPILKQWKKRMTLGGVGGGGGGGGGGGCNLRVILVRVCEPAFQNLPHSYTWPSEKRTHSYT